MSIHKAVITAGAPSQKSLPLQSCVDRGGCDKTALELLCEDLVDAGAEEICVIICPGEETNYERAAGPHARRLVFVEQPEPKGYANAILLAREFTGDQPFLHVLSDHLFVSGNRKSCARQLVEIAGAESCAVSVVQRSRENMLPYFGVVGGQRVTGRNDLYEVKRVVEKPTPTQAEQELMVAGLRSSYYLCLFGMHVITPMVMELLEEKVAETGDVTAVTLSDALDMLCRRERYLALEIDGTRHNLGIKYGSLRAQLALALSGRDRDEILAQVLEVVAQSNSAATDLSETDGRAREMSEAQ